jgi:uncharacterized protein (DUF1330 family)
MTEAQMPKAYWITFYQSIADQGAIDAYAKLAGPALKAAGARLVVAGLPTEAHERGLKQRVVLFEFDSIAQATAAHESSGYKEALRVLGDAAVRDVRIVEGPYDN